MDLKPPKQSDKLPGEVAKSNNSHTVAPGASRAGAQAIPGNGRTREQMSEDMKRYWRHKRTVR
jgi:murein endopeptidase